MTDETIARKLAETHARDFVSVEDDDRGFKVVVWTIDGSPATIVKNVSASHAEAVRATIAYTIGTWVES